MPLVPLVAHMGIGQSVEATRKDQARGLADIQRQQQMRASIQYAPDADGMARYPHGQPRRVATARCPQCGGEFRVHQLQDLASGTWQPEATERLLAFGWQLREELAFCGKTCAEIFGVQMLRHGGEPIPPVKRIADASYAKTAYATPPVDETTPAVPPGRASAKR